jgi:hypothetical protein
MTPAAAPWRSRVVGHGEVARASLLANPRNGRSHPPEQQRALAEERYLDGCAALFQATGEAWVRQLHETRKLTAMALGGWPTWKALSRPAQDEELLSRLVDRMLADLVEWAKATALEKLGEGERGPAIARDWLRPKLERPPAGLPARHAEATTP